VSIGPRRVRASVRASSSCTTRRSLNGTRISSRISCSQTQSSPVPATLLWYTSSQEDSQLARIRRQVVCTSWSESAPSNPDLSPSYTNDGYTCRRDVSVVSKPSYGRGVGRVSNQCGAGRELDAGLCYPLCTTGYHGVGPVCWGSCPPDYRDDGLTCRRDAKIITDTARGTTNEGSPLLGAALFAHPGYSRWVYLPHRRVHRNQAQLWTWGWYCTQSMCCELGV